MKIDEQHLLPAHLVFYKKKWFWFLVLLGIYITTSTYMLISYSFLGYAVFLTTDTFLPYFIFSTIVQSGYLGYGITITLYAILLYFIFFRKRINYYALSILIILMLWSFYFSIDFINSPFT